MTNREMTIFVNGVPRPKGSWKWVRGKTIPSSKYLLKWLADIQWIAQSKWVGKPIPAGTGVGVSITFWLPPPGKVRKDWPFPANPPDVDKLLRAVLDGLTSISYDDDGQVVEAAVLKRFAASSTETGAEIRVWQVDDAEHLRIQSL